MHNQEKSHDGKTKNITLKLVLSWIISVVIILVGIGVILVNIGAGLIIIFSGFIIFPPTNRFLRKKYNFNLSGALRFIIAIILFAIGLNMSVKDNMEEKLEMASIRSQNQTANESEVNVSNEKLELISRNCGREYGVFYIRGEVKNISDRALDSVEAVGSTYTKDGVFVKSSNALIAYDPILPGQTSPFEVLGTDNPEITNCGIEFKEFFGGTIPTKRND